MLGRTQAQARIGALPGSFDPSRNITFTPPADPSQIANVGELTGDSRDTLITRQ